MNKKELVALGIAEDVADQIVVIHGKDIEKHKTAVDTSKSEAQTLKDQLAEANKQIESFKSMDVDSIKKTADEYRVKYEQAEKDSNEKLAALKFDHALQGALVGAKAKNIKAVQALLTRDLLKLNDADGSISGLNEQLETIRKDNDYLFQNDNPPPKIVTGGNNKSVVGDAMMIAARKAAGLPTEQT